MADIKETLAKFLTTEGYLPTPEGAGLVFKKEGRTYFTFPDAADPNFFNLYSYFDFADAVPNRTIGMEAANDINKAVKAVKVTLMEEEKPGRVSFGMEVPLPLPESFPGIFERSLNTIGYAVEQFAERVKARTPAP